MRGRKFVTAMAILLALQTVASGAPIGSASATKNEVAGIVGGQTRQLASGSEVFSNELIRTGAASIGDFVFLDNTKLSVGPTSEVRLDKFVYNPSGSNSSVVLRATRGAFQFVTGALDKRAYNIVTPYGTIGVRGTGLRFKVVQCRGLPECGLSLQVFEGEAFVRLPNGQVVDVPEGTMITVSPEGVVTGPSPAPTSIIDFASLEEGTTVFADLPPALVGVLAVGAVVPIVVLTKKEKPASP